MTAKPNWTPTIIDQLGLARQNLEARERQLRVAYTALQEIRNYVSELKEAGKRPSAKERETVIRKVGDAMLEIG